MKTRKCNYLTHQTKSDAVHVCYFALSIGDVIDFPSMHHGLQTLPFLDIHVEGQTDDELTLHFFAGKLHRMAAAY